LETWNDLDGDEEFFNVTNPGTEEPISYLFGKIGDDYESTLKYLNKQEATSIEKSDYKSLWKVMTKLIRILEKVEAKGISLTSIFDYSGWNQKKQFKIFFINLDIWGNWEENSKLCVSKIPFSWRKSAKEKIEFTKITLGRCIVLMKEEKGKLFEIIRFKTTVLYNAFEKISNYLHYRTKIPENVKSQISNLKKLNIQKTLMKSSDIIKGEEIYEVNTDQNEEDKFESIHLGVSKINDSQITEEHKLEHWKEESMKFKNNIAENPFKNDPHLRDPNYLKYPDGLKYPNISLNSPFDPLPDKIGHLLLLHCGHNGNFSIEEKRLYEKHLKKAGFIT